MESTLNELLAEMIKYYRGDARRIQHFIKVHALARYIGEREGLDAQTLFTLETAAIVHDIGAKAAIEKHGESSGKLQELEGPAPAREMLARLGFEAGVIDRVARLVSRHHTYTDVDGPDYRILLEADFLVNLYERDEAPQAVSAAYESIFKTAAGRELCREMFALDGEDEG